jgi:hypothetical protein
MKTHIPHPRPRAAAVVVVLALAALGLTACGSAAQPKSSNSSSSSAQKLAITIKGDTITPTQKRIPVKLDEPLTLTITSDRSGELHVHSSPEQHIEFRSGTTTKTITLKVPGLVELEEHHSNTLIAQLEVR